MEEKKLLLSEFLNLCVDFENEPTEERQEAINKFLSDLSIKEYMPLSEKAITAFYIISEIDNENYDIFGVTTNLEIAKFFKGLVYYATNLINDASPLDRTYACYDTCVKYGLYDKIRSSCNKDYQMLLTYINDAINMNNIFRICKTTSLFDGDSKNNFIEMLSRVEKTLTPELLESLAEFNNNKSDILGNFTKMKTQKELLDDKRTLKQVIEDTKNENNEELN